MPRGMRKENLPAKVCVVCDQPFTWRKKWERCWDEVTTCSRSCNRKRRSATKNYCAGAQGGDCGIPNNSNNDSGGAGDSLLHAAMAELADVMDNADRTVVDEGDRSAGDDDSDDESPSSRVASSSAASPKDAETSSGIVDVVSESSSSVTSPSSLPRKQESGHTTTLDAKARRKAEKKRRKAERRARREGRGDVGEGRKECTICGRSVDLLVRCTHDETGNWGMVCGKCWNDVSGGVTDGDDAHPHYRYGGLWKNRRAQR